MRAPHGRAVAKVCAVAARIVVPAVGPVGAVPKVPAGAWTRQVIEREHLNMPIFSGREDLWGPMKGNIGARVNSRHLPVESTWGGGGGEGGD